MLRFLTYLQARETKSEAGAIALEYVILAGLAIAAVSGSFAVFGPKLIAKFNGLLP